MFSVSELGIEPASWGGSRPVSRVLSRTVIHLRLVSPRASSDLPGGDAGHAPRSSRAPHAPLFGLAPGGVYPATGVTTGAVRSYRTISPLPRPSIRERGGIFSVALSVGSRPPGVTWHPALRSPDFPPHCFRGTATVWSTPGTSVQWNCVHFKLLGSVVSIPPTEASCSHSDPNG